MLLVLLLARGGGVGRGMVLSIVVEISVGLAQVDRWADAWTDRSAAETYWERKGNPLSELHPVLAQEGSTENSFSFTCPLSTQPQQAHESYHKRESPGLRLESQRGV